MSKFLTSKEEKVITLIFEWLGESRINRTYNEYMAIAARIPKLEACVAHVNQRLAEIAPKMLPFCICHFQAGDRSIRWAHFPRSVSKETVRTALIKSGMRPKRTK